MLANKPRVFNFVGLGKVAVLLAVLVIVAGALHYRASEVLLLGPMASGWQSQVVLGVLLSLGAGLTLRSFPAMALATAVAVGLDMLVVLALFALLDLSIDPRCIAVLFAVAAVSWLAKLSLFRRIVATLQSARVEQPLSLSALANRSSYGLLQRGRYVLMAGVLAAGTLGAGPLLPGEALVLIVGLFTASVSTACIASAIWLTLQQRHMRTVVPTRYRAAFNSRPFLATLLVLIMLGMGGWFWLPSHSASNLHAGIATLSR